MAKKLGVDPEWLQHGDPPVLDAPGLGGVTVFALFSHTHRCAIRTALAGSHKIVWVQNNSGYNCWVHEQVILRALGKADQNVSAARIAGG